MLTTQYMPADELEEIFDEHDLSSLSDEKKNRAIQLAVGNLESELNKRFVVPIRAKAGAYEDAPMFARMKVELAFRASFLYVLGNKFMRNSELVDLGDFTSAKFKEFQSHIKALLDYQNDFEFKLKPLAQDAQEPLQVIGIARANNEMSQDYGD